MWNPFRPLRRSRHWISMWDLCHPLRQSKYVGPIWDHFRPLKRSRCWISTGDPFRLLRKLILWVYMWDHCRLLRQSKYIRSLCEILAAHWGDPNMLDLYVRSLSPIEAIKICWISMISFLTIKLIKMLYLYGGSLSNIEACHTSKNGNTTSWSAITCSRDWLNRVATELYLFPRRGRENIDKTPIRTTKIW